eukprot:Anaeramoba_ignava/c18078_g1_i1.p6 GENE.c18078_g1_i1~~c18078_g1_i1.p6  ORF type:complete len:188 (+),score=56.86 c18078_g1_i1:5026-5589(+)
MEIILMNDIKKLGQAGDIVKVANGYARNFLLPQGHAIMASTSNKNKISGIKEAAAAEREKEIAAMKEIAAKINNLEIVFERKTDEKGHLFGSVSENDIAAELAERGANVHKSLISLEKHIKEVGTTDVTVNFSAEVTAALKITVKSDSFEVIKEEAVAEETVQEEVVEETTEEQVEIKEETIEEVTE